ncbi:MAG: carotenoid 1,2-hydratase [Hyphomonadaceae bacterium]|nr:carotenoid 1,2-hydratase [Hyphomonadaceae bacterium]
MAPGGYAWWYLDAFSDDGRFGLTLIAFVGSVFSPYYAWSGWRDPADHCAVNVALYRLDGGGGRWAMTERGRGQVHRDATALSVGPSALSWEGDTLVARIDEIAAPIPSRLRGVIRLTPQIATDELIALDSARRHLWRPFAPRARVSVDFTDPDLHWVGDGYHDGNAGDEPLERGFAQWSWARAHLSRDVALYYDAERRDGTRHGLALRVSHAGDVSSFAPPPLVDLPRTGWGVERRTWRDGEATPRVRKTLEDTPFYARTALSGSCDGETAVIMHESLSLDRLRSPIVRAMLPFRMPRIVW